MFNSLDQLLGGRLKHLKLNKQVEGANVCALWQKYANKFFLKSIMENHDAISFREGVLTVLVTNPIYSQEIRNQEWKIVLAINKELGDKVLKRVVYR